jgi:hypothetical protein
MRVSSFQRLDAMLQKFVPLGVVRQRFKFRDQIQNVFRAVANIFDHVFFRIEHEILRQITHDEIALPCHFAAVGRLQTGENAQKSRLARAVATDETEAFAFLDAERGGVEDGAVAVANGDFRGGNDGGHLNYSFAVCTGCAESGVFLLVSPK